MTEQETIAVLAVLRAGLPNAFLKITDADAAAMVALWAEMFSGYNGNLVMAAAKTYIWQDTTGRFPGPGNIRQTIEDLQEAIGNYADYTPYLVGDKYPPKVLEYIKQEAHDVREERYARLTFAGMPLATRRMAP